MSKRETRLNLRIDVVLLRWVKAYAAQNNTTVSALVRDHFRKLREHPNGKSEVSQF